MEGVGAQEHAEQRGGTRGTRLRAAALGGLRLRRGRRVGVCCCRGLRHEQLPHHAGSRRSGRGGGGLAPTPHPPSPLEGCMSFSHLEGRAATEQAAARDPQRPRHRGRARERAPVGWRG